MNLTISELGGKPEGFFERKVRLFLHLGSLQSLAIDSITKRDSHYLDVCLNYSNIPLRFYNNNVIIVNCHPGGVIENLENYKKTFKLTKQIEASASTIDAFIPHSIHSIGNHLAFNFCYDNIYLLPDGALNYYRSNVSPTLYRKMLIKKVVALCLGGRYKRYRGCLTGAKSISFAGYYMFSTTGVLTNYGKYFAIDTPEYNLDSAKSKTLFLDHTIDHLPNEKRALVQQALDNYLSKEVSFSYKPHRNQTVPSFKDISRYNCEQLTTTLPSELLIREESYTKVVSMYSSGLLAAKTIYPSLCCVSIGMEHFVQNDPTLKDMQNTMKKLGVEML